MAGEDDIRDYTQRGKSDLQLAELTVTGLFGRYTHTIPFPTSRDDSNSFASVLILHGPNGIGKTTTLRMLEGLMQLNFSIFREVPFVACELGFSNGDRISVRAEGIALNASFAGHHVVLDGRRGQKGALNPQNAPEIEDFRKDFFRVANNISFNFIDADRAQRAKFLAEISGDSRQEALMRHYWPAGAPDTIRTRVGRHSMADMVREFIRDAQLDASEFFGSSEPGLFSRIIENLQRPSGLPIDIGQIHSTIEKVKQLDEEHRRFGLRVDKWDPTELLQMLDSSDTDNNAHALTVLQTYADLLSSRAEARDLVAERLRTFEVIMSEFFADKIVSISPESGVEIRVGDSLIDEFQLSSGEHQLLHLMVAALTTRRKGTVLAIDEPELSMHISWQRKLVRNLVRCASRAAPQIILATHSPEIANEYSDSMIMLTDSRRGTA